MSAVASLAAAGRRRDAVLAVAVAAVVAALPVVAPGVSLFSMTKAICFGIAIVGLKLLSGHGGQFSLGHSAFLALSAYVAVLVTPAIGFTAAVLAAALASLLLGAFIGVVGLRIRGHALGLLTFVVALAATQLPKASVLVPVTGGSSGLPFHVALPSGNRDLWWYWIAAGTAIAVTVGVHLLLRGRFGRALRASRDNALAARAMGVNTAAVDVLAFSISGGCAGIAGGLLAGVIGYVGNDTFPYTVAILLFIGMAVTGPRSLPGAFVGGALIVFLPPWADTLARDVSWGIFGGALLLLLYIQVAGPGIVRRLTNSAGPTRHAGDHS